MMRIRTVVAVGSMALLGVVATGSSALATGGPAPATAKPVSPAKVAHCLGQAGATVTRTEGGGYKIVVPGRKIAHALRACKQYLPPGTAAPTGHGSGSLVIQIGGAPTAAFGKADKKFVQCLTDHGAQPPAVTGAGKVGTTAPGADVAVPSDDGPTTIVSGTVVSGTVGSDDGGPSTVVSGDDAKLTKALQACASLSTGSSFVPQSAS